MLLGYPHHLGYGWRSKQKDLDIKTKSGKKLTLQFLPGPIKHKPTLVIFQINICIFFHNDPYTSQYLLIEYFKWYKLTFLIKHIYFKIYITWNFRYFPALPHFINKYLKKEAVSLWFDLCCSKAYSTSNTPW